jgi:hypothetical protein
LSLLSSNRASHSARRYREAGRCCPECVGLRCGRETKI